MSMIFPLASSFYLYPDHLADTPTLWLPLFLSCCVIRGSSGSILYVLTASPGLHFAVFIERVNFSVYPRCCWLSHTDSMFVGLFLCKFLLGGCFTVVLCVFCCDVWVSWDRAVYGRHFINGRVRGQCDVLFSLNKNFELLQASGLHSYHLAFSFILVTWYFMGHSFVFTETTRLYS